MVGLQQLVALVDVGVVTAGGDGVVVVVVECEGGCHHRQSLQKDQVSELSLKE